MGNLSPNSVSDYLRSFGQGMNADQDPQLLPKDQCAMATNATFRGMFLRPRAPFRTLTIDYTGDFDGSGLFQGAAYYKPDYGAEYLVAQIGGRHFKFIPSGNVCTTEEISLAGHLNPAALTEAWMWQCENYLITNDGQSQPLIWDGGTMRRASTGEVLGTVSGGPYTIGAMAVAPVSLSSPNPYPGPFNVMVEVRNAANGVIGKFQITQYTAASPVAGEYPVLLAGSSGTAYGAGTHLFISNAWSSQLATSKTILSGATGTLVANNAFTGQVNDYIDYGGYQFKVTAVSGTSITVRNGNAFAQVFNAGDTITLKNPPPDTLLGILVSSVTLSTTGTAVQALIDRPFTGAAVSATLGTSPVTVSKVTVSSGNNVNLTNVGSSGSLTITSGCTINNLQELPPGRMGAYVLGRNWICLPDGISFVASDQVGDSSGSSATNYRDAVLKMVGNTYLLQGGSFRVPGGSGEITFMVDLATLDASLGQGPVQIGTPSKVFSCQATTWADRDTWETQTNPILTESLIANGGLSQHSAVVANGDLFMRSVDGIRSLVLARREFATWGNTPQSAEVDSVLSADDDALLKYCSGVFFDNRLLMTANPVFGPQGVYWTKTIALNSDPVSTLRGKAPSIYDGVWTGMNVLRYITGRFSGVERCFAFCYNTTLARIELWEVLPSPAPSETTLTNLLDNETTNITVTMESPMLLNARAEPDKYKFTRLDDGEIYVKDLLGAVTFTVWFRPDYDSTWTQWRKWQRAAGTTYEHRMGLGEPTPADLTRRLGYGFQVKIEITGHCVFMGMRVIGTTIPEQTCAGPVIGTDI